MIGPCFLPSGNRLGPKRVSRLEASPALSPLLVSVLRSLTASSTPPTAPSPAMTQSHAQTPPPPPATTEVSAPLVYTYATGQWVYAAGPGWVWVPSDATTIAEEGVPYVYLYTPAYGWTWYVSPWGWGPYHYGPWIRHPWHPIGWHGYWVARPHVVVRLGGGAHFRGGYHRR